MEYTAAVFANTGSLGRRGLLKINNKPMIEYVLDSVPEDARNILILSHGSSLDDYKVIAEGYDAEVQEAVDESLDIRFHLQNVFEKVNTEGVLALSCDTPLINRDVTGFLRSIITRFSAGIPRPVLDKPEFTPASYRVEPFLNAMRNYPNLPMAELVKHVNNVLFISAQSFRVFDQKLRFLMKVQNAADARKVAQILQAIE